MRVKSPIEELNSVSNEVDNIAKDFFLTLLVIFILVVIITPPVSEAMRMNLPSIGKDVQSVNTENENRSIEITVTKDGKITLDERPISSLDSLKRRMMDLRTSQGSESIIINIFADKDTAYHSIIGVLSVLNSLGFHSVYLHGYKEEEK